MKNFVGVSGTQTHEKLVPSYSQEVLVSVAWPLGCCSPHAERLPGELCPSSRYHSLASTGEDLAYSHSETKCFIFHDTGL